MKMFLAILVCLFFVACTPYNSVESLSGSSDSQTVLTPNFAASSDSIASLSTQDRVYVTYANFSTRPINLTIYGYNGSNVSIREWLIVNATNTNISTAFFSVITRIVLNQTATVTVTVSENLTRSNTILTFPIGNTDAYIQQTANNVLPDLLPNICLNSSSARLAQFTEYSLYTVCSDVITALQFTPQVSPDDSNWFVLPAVFCDSNRTITPISASTPGIQYVRVQACSFDSNSSQALVAFSMK